MHMVELQNKTTYHTNISVVHKNNVLVRPGTSKYLLVNKKTVLIYPGTKENLLQ